MQDTDVDSASEYLASYYFDVNNLTWEEQNGTYTMSLPESQWELVHKLDLNMFYDDGSGYIDLGLDNIYSFDDDGKLIADTEPEAVVALPSQNLGDVLQPIVPSVAASLSDTYGTQGQTQVIDDDQHVLHWYVFLQQPVTDGIA